MCTNYVTLLEDVFFYPYELEFIQNLVLVRVENKSLAVAFNSKVRYIDDVIYMCIN